MSYRDDDTKWRAVGKSVRGASHARRGDPLQDAIEWSPDNGPGKRLVLAVADGHGSPRCFRSGTGALLAVTAAISELGFFAQGLESADTPALVSQRVVQRQLPESLTNNWRKQVSLHLDENPFTGDELARLEENAGASAGAASRHSQILAYGSTLIGVLVTESFILGLQIGDGDIVLVANDGAPSRPMIGDERLFANETTSLSASTATEDFRYFVLPIDRSTPRLILLSTDGYANSFRDDSAFLKVGSDIFNLIRTRGLNFVENELSGWLIETSSRGSGDDITLGLICDARLDRETARVQSPLPIDEMPQVVSEDHFTPDEHGAPKISDAPELETARLDEPITGIVSATDLGFAVEVSTPGESVAEMPSARLASTTGQGNGVTSVLPELSRVAQPADDPLQSPSTDDSMRRDGVDHIELTCDH